MLSHEIKTEWDGSYRLQSCITRAFYLNTSENFLAQINWKICWYPSHDGCVAANNVIHQANAEQGQQKESTRIHARDQSGLLHGKNSFYSNIPKSLPLRRNDKTQQQQQQLPHKHTTHELQIDTPVWTWIADNTWIQLNTSILHWCLFCCVAMTFDIRFSIWHAAPFCPVSFASCLYVLSGLECKIYHSMLWLVMRWMWNSVISYISFFYCISKFVPERRNIHHYNFHWNFC